MSILPFSVLSCHKRPFLPQTSIILTWLKGRKVVLFPDLGQMANWHAKAGMMRLQGIDVKVYTYLEEHATEEEKEEGLDIADYLLNEPP